MLDQALYILDISNSSAPTLRGQYSLGGIGNSITVVNQTAFIPVDYDLLILDMHNPAAPVLLSRYDLKGSGVKPIVEGNLMYLISISSGGRQQDNDPSG
jgi:hypothetical protein